MYNIISDLLTAYRSTPETLKALLRDYSPKIIVTPKNVEDEWSVVEVICHLRDTEDASLTRTRLMRDQVDPPLSARDPVKLAIDLSYASTSLDEALSAFLRFRTEHLQELVALSLEQWEQTGQHPSAGQITISGQVAHLVAHDAIHLAQISRELSIDGCRNEY